MLNLNIVKIKASFQIFKLEINCLKCFCFLFFFYTFFFSLGVQELLQVYQQVYFSPRPSATQIKGLTLSGGRISPFFSLLQPAQNLLNGVEVEASRGTVHHLVLSSVFLLRRYSSSSNFSINKEVIVSDNTFAHISRYISMLTQVQDLQPCKMINILSAGSHRPIAGITNCWKCDQLQTFVFSEQIRLFRKEEVTRDGVRCRRVAVKRFACLKTQLHSLCLPLI